MSDTPVTRSPVYQVRVGDRVEWCGQLVPVLEIRTGLSGRKPSHWFHIKALDRKDSIQECVIHYYDFEDVWVMTDSENLRSQPFYANWIAGRKQPFRLDELVVRGCRD